MWILSTWRESNCTDLYNLCNFLPSPFLYPLVQIAVESCFAPTKKRSILHACWLLWWDLAPGALLYWHWAINDSESRAHLWRVYLGMGHPWVTLISYIIWCERSPRKTGSFQFPLEVLILNSNMSQNSPLSCNWTPNIGSSFFSRFFLLVAFCIWCSGLAAT